MPQGKKHRPIVKPTQGSEYDINMNIDEKVNILSLSLNIQQLKKKKKNCRLSNVASSTIQATSC